MERIVPSLKNAKALDNFEVALEFDDGTKGIVSLKDFKGLFEKFSIDFNKVSFTDSALVWSEEVEFDLLNLYLQLTNQTFEEYACC